MKEKQLTLLLVLLFATAYAALSCNNYVCSNQYPTCTKKGGANVYINSGACACKSSHDSFIKYSWRGVLYLRR